jgi:uncharacterized lipoprotein NlpE involved in copper resistance
MKYAFLAAASAIALSLGGCANFQQGGITPAAANANPAAKDDASQMPGESPAFVGTFENQEAARDLAARDAAAARAQEGSTAGSGSSSAPANGATQP